MSTSEKRSLTQHTSLQGEPGPEVVPKSVKVNVTTGTGLDIEWKDGHQSHYSFQYLRDACPCALCDDARPKQGRDPGDPEKSEPGSLPMFKAMAKPLETAGVGRYAIRFKWNDNHESGIYSWEFLRQWCPCQQCRGRRAMQKDNNGAPGAVN
jgi:DUF971 family protein